MAAAKAFAQFFPPREATVVSPKRARPKYSAGCILTATLAKGLEKRINMMMPTKPPTTEATREMPRPQPALPCWARG